MKIRIDIDDRHEETSITIHAKEWTEELAALVSKLQSSEPRRLVGIEEDRSVLLDPAELDYVYAESRKVYAALKQRRIELRMKLYEVEELLAGYRYMRFSKSVIGNLDEIDRFELSFNGNLCVYFRSGNKEYVSRSYVAELKQRLILGGGRDGV
ncbi:LytTR family DNA-binding domain-containing protein [Paenibacillus pinihumi]|uniref:LytTR family DNA-binding domain-containing protein n=1 Tax=Paenibacillus pinihumi TaxID=669462 RepID=UPI00040DBD02|nr:LytTR family DNA-binding domain-containing protein [Paenibacillus pinihumi]